MGPLEGMSLNVLREPASSGFVAQASLIRRALREGVPERREGHGQGNH